MTLKGIQRLWHCFSHQSPGSGLVPPSFQKIGGFLCFWGQGSPRPGSPQREGQGCPQSCGRGAATSFGPENETSSWRGFFSSCEFQWNLPCWIFDLLGNPSPLSSFQFLPLEWQYPFYACPTVVFGKHRTCLVSQTHSYRGILPRDESYHTSPHPYLF